MSIKLNKTTVTFEPEELQQLAQILMDADPQGALRYLDEVVAGKIRCHQVESHRPAFEGGRGNEPAHYLQKGEGHSEAPKA
jgi:hypothetical protein